MSTSIMSSTSQVTLAVTTPNTCLNFGRDSMQTTTVLCRGKPVYAISTDQHGATTEVRVPGTQALVARIARKELLPDTVAFPDVGDGKALRVSKWLRRTKLADGLPAAILETDIGECVLRIHPEYRLALFTPDLSIIIAHWESGVTPPTLVLAPGIERSQAHILAAFLYEEQKMRIAERNGDPQIANFKAKLEYRTTLTTGVF
ncbi:hypothetical protein B0H11DRAFT_1959699 [Mycena galericulata]|nr:hypothetical protein B0H11DRAFT_1959699 [Mycena galericulata]